MSAAAGDLCHVAQAYAERLGWPVFPLRRKLPTISKEARGRGHHDATVNPEAIAELWRRARAGGREPDGIGVNLEPARLVLLDVDNRNGGSLEVVREAIGLLPDTPEALTGQYPEGRGSHLYFSRSSTTPATSIVGVWPGIDLKANGYAVLPPSRHPTGVSYEWRIRPSEVPVLPPLPEQLADLLGRARDSGPSSNGATPEDGDRIPTGQRNKSLASIGGKLLRSGLDEVAIAAALLEVNRARCVPPLSEDEVRKIAKSVGGYANGQSKAGAPPPVRLARLADIPTQPLAWVWEPRLPRDFVSVLAGDPGTGKSYIGCAVATAVSLGQGLPDSVAGEPGNVLLVSAEDHFGKVLRPRLEAMGADLQRIFVLLEGDEGHHAHVPSLTTSEGRAVLEEKANECHAALIILDPAQAFQGAIDAHRANEVRSQFMGPLAAMAERLGLSILLIAHLAKGGSRKLISRVLGSVDHVAAVRSGLAVGVDPNDPSDRALFHFKSNVGPLAEPLGFSLDGGEFRWLDQTHLTSAAIMGEPDEDAGPALEGATEWVQSFIHAGDGVKDGCPVRLVSDVLKAAKKAGHAQRTIYRAKDKAGVDSVSAHEVQWRDGSPTWLPPAAKAWILRSIMPNTESGTNGSVEAASGSKNGEESTQSDSAKGSAPPAGWHNQSAAPGEPSDAPTEPTGDVASSGDPVEYAGTRPTGGGTDAPPPWTCACGMASVGDACWNCRRPRPMVETATESEQGV